MRQYRNWSVNTYHCSDCRREMRSGDSRPDGRPGYASNGRCNACHMKVRQRFEPVTWPVRKIDQDSLLSEYELLRSDGVPPAQMPRRLSMTPIAFEKALYRARRAGDSRAATFRGMADGRQR